MLNKVIIHTSLQRSQFWMMYTVNVTNNWIYYKFLSFLKGAYANDSHNFYSYIRGMRKFELPVPNELGQLEEVNVIEVKATVDTAPNAHDVVAMGIALARRDLNVVPSFLPGK